MEAETGAMQLKVREHNTKDYWPSPGARREAQDRFLLELLEGAGPCRQVDFRLPTARMVRE